MSESTPSQVETDTSDQARRAVAHPIVPDEVRRLRLEPGERLVVRIASTSGITPRHLAEYQAHLQAAIPETQVIALCADEIATESATTKEA